MKAFSKDFKLKHLVIGFPFFCLVQKKQKTSQIDRSKQKPAQAAAIWRANASYVSV